jgi:hypothetical protein
MQDSRLYHPGNPRRLCRRLAALPVSLPLLALGCSADQVELGGNEAELTAPTNPACDGGVVDHDVTTYEQADIDALAGCEEIQGKLWLRDFPGMDLSPLASLRSVRDTLYVGMPDGDNPIESLHGLEALEHVGGLHISRLLESDLRGLRNLRSVRVRDPQQAFGHTSMIELGNCHALLDLGGLEQLQDWSMLMIQGVDELRSLNGLTPPPSGGMLWVLSAPQLRDVSALGAARDMDAIRLHSTGVENFDGVDLETLQLLELNNNPALVQLDGLDGLRALNQLEVSNNDALQRLPQLPGLQSMRSLQVTGNDVLLNIPAYPVQFVASYLVGGFDHSANKPENVPVAFEFFVVGNNAALLRASAPRGYTNAGILAVYDNPNLTELDLGGLAEVDTLSLRANAALTDVDVSSLQLVKRLEVVGNPQLPLTGFDGVAAAVKQLSATLPQ